MPTCELVPYDDRFDPGVPSERAAEGFFRIMKRRRTVRTFSDRPVSRETIEWIVRTAGSAPSGANKQPWRFVCVEDPALKHRIRAAAEEEEREFYEHRASRQWLEDLRELGTHTVKEFLETAPWLIAIFKLSSTREGGHVYYATESVGIAAGFLIAAAHHAGLVTVTHTPSPMGFLGSILERPRNERPFLLIPVGYPAEDCRIPAAALRKKPLDEIMVVDAPTPPD